MEHHPQQVSTYRFGLLHRQLLLQSWYRGETQPQDRHVLLPGALHDFELVFGFFYVALRNLSF
jgi:hypothetical protein